MIQRIQTIYLLLVMVVLTIVPNFTNIWTNAGDVSVTINGVFADDKLLLKMIPVLYYGGGLLALIALFQFKNRQLQFVLGRVNMLINLFLLGALIYLSLTLSGEAMVSEKGIGMFLPVIAILFLVLANRAIKKDEDLVKSVDRLR